MLWPRLPGALVQAWLLQKLGEEVRGGGTRAAPCHQNQVSLLLFPAIIPAKLGEHTPGAIAQRLRFMILSPGKYEFIPAAPASPLGLHVAPARLVLGTTSQKARASSTPSPFPSAPRVQLQGSSCQHPELVWVGWEGLLRQRLSGGQDWPRFSPRTVSELGTCKPLSFTDWP